MFYVSWTIKKNRTLSIKGKTGLSVQQKYVGETKRKLGVRVKEHRTETEKVSQEGQEDTVTDGDAGLSYHRPCSQRL